MDSEELKSIRVKNTLANFIVPLVAVLISILLIVVVIYPSYTSMPETQQELDSAISLRNQLDEKVKKLNNLLDFKSSIDENLDIMSNALYSEPRVPELLTQIDAIANEAGLEVRKLGYSISEVRSGQSDNQTDYEIVSVSLGVAGTYEQMVVFLDSLENAARMVSVTNIRMAEEGGENPLYVSNFVVTSPYVEITASADTDKPITFDVNDPEFQNLMGKVKALRVYDVNLVDTFTEIQETTEDGEVVVIDNTPETPVDPLLEVETPLDTPETPETPAEQPVPGQPEEPAL